MARLKFHMRMVAQSIEPPAGTSDMLAEGGVCIDVVLRGEDASSIDRVRSMLQSRLDFDYIGAWAGIGRGEYVDESRNITLG